MSLSNRQFQKPIQIISALIFLLMPWYFTDSGQLQPVDCFIIGLFGIFMLLGFPVLRHVFHSTVIYRSFVWFSLYIVCILLLDIILETNYVTLGLLWHNLYCMLMLTSFLLMVAYLYEVKGNKFYSLLQLLLCFDLVLPLLKLLSKGTLGSRESLTFNNANQLGFYALANLSILYYVSLLAVEKNIKLSKIQSLIILNVNFIFLMVSTSRACYPAILIYILSYFTIFRLKVSGYGFYLLLFFNILLALILIFVVGDMVYQHMQSTRMDVKVLTATTVYNEFYFRAFKGAESSFDNIWLFLFGNGKYTTNGRLSLEFHNNFIAIFFQVGLVGLILYLIMNVFIFRELIRRGILYLVPYLCYLYYSMFHYSYRTRINWLLLAVIIFIALNNVQFKRKDNLHAQE